MFGLFQVDLLIPDGKIILVPTEACLKIVVLENGLVDCDMPWSANQYNHNFLDAWRHVQSLLRISLSRSVTPLYHPA